MRHGFLRTWSDRFSWALLSAPYGFLEMMSVVVGGPGHPFDFWSGLVGKLIAVFVGVLAFASGRANLGQDPKRAWDGRRAKWPATFGQYLGWVITFQTLFSGVLSLIAWGNFRLFTGVWVALPLVWLQIVLPLLLSSAVVSGIAWFRFAPEAK